MSTVIVGCTASVLYVITAARVLQTSKAGKPSFNILSVTGLIGSLALIFHATTIFSRAVRAEGVSLDVYTTASTIAWLMSGLVLIGSRRQSLAALSLVVFPFSGILVSLSLLFSADLLIAETVGVRIHVALSLLAYSLFSIAALQSAYIIVAEYKLKNHTPIMQILPPLALMENLLFQLTSVAFILLTVGLIIGLFVVDDVFNQHLSHKIVFSVLAWLTFLSLLFGRYFKGWRGKKATYLVMGGSVCLAIGFLGSKFVLEVLLAQT